MTLSTFETPDDRSAHTLNQKKNNQKAGLGSDHRRTDAATHRHHGQVLQNREMQQLKYVDKAEETREQWQRQNPDNAEKNNEPKKDRPGVREGRPRQRRELLQNSAGRGRAEQ